MHEPITRERLVEVLELDLSETMTGQDAGVGTLQGLLFALAEKVWIEEEGFGGKRPFGNSGWQHEVYAAIATKGWCAVEDESAEEKWPASTTWVDQNLIIPAMRLAFLTPVGKRERKIAKLKAERDELRWMREGLEK